MTIARVTKRRNRVRRRGVALFDAIIGGLILGISLSVVLTIAGRSLTVQTTGEKRITASWLADELLTMVLVEGPDRYPRVYDTSATFGEPFEEFAYDVSIEDLGRDAPYRVNAVVRWGHRPQDSVRVETLIALRAGDPEQLREPYEPLDRDQRNFGDDE